MSNDSTAPGYLTPVHGPTYDEALERQISRWIRGVTGMEKITFIRAGLTRNRRYRKRHYLVRLRHYWRTGRCQPRVYPGDESAEQWSHETIDILVCFYGPQGMTVATRFRDGLFVSQNNDELKNSDLTLLDCGRIFNLPELINNQWVRRYDIAVRLRRKVIREYGIKVAGGSTGSILRRIIYVTGLTCIEHRQCDGEYRRALGAQFRRATIVGGSDVIDGSQRMRSYSGITDVGAGFRYGGAGAQGR